ncbi:hypothetical protein [Paenibacillus endoradicis]|uniref:hypothetical protein n=1 Tax=Paenibacillus endoradicis TaxID=2972487 RepID=UPI002159A183|nr:hypothetical protein [Paenibacillus endoradicis]MCR8660252.1 hypothetical protein [Paenibacillus endoradicis]
MRAIDKKRSAWMTPRKWITFSILFLILITVLLVMFYRSIQMDRWNEKAAVRISLQEQYDLSTESYLEKYIWEEQYWILLAKTWNGQEQYAVWQDNNILTSVNTDAIVSSEVILQRLQSSNPAAQNITIEEAYLSGQLAWEVHYSENASDYTIYAFYAMSDGKLINEYTIPKETRS